MPASRQTTALMETTNMILHVFITEKRC